MSEEKDLDNLKIDQFLKTFELCRRSLEMNIYTWKNCGIASKEFVEEFECALYDVNYLINFTTESRQEILDVMQSF